MQGFPINEYDQEREDMELTEKNMKTTNFIESTMQANRKKADKENQERRAQAFWVNKMAVDDHDYHSAPLPPQGPSHDVAQFIGGFYPPRQGMYLNTRTVPNTFTPHYQPPPTPPPPTYPNPYSFYASHYVPSKDGV